MIRQAVAGTADHDKAVQQTRRLKMEGKSSDRVFAVAADTLLGQAEDAGATVRTLLSIDETYSSSGEGAQEVASSSRASSDGGRLNTAHLSTLSDGRARLTARSLLALSVSGGMTKWVGWQHLPQRLADQRSGPEARVARHAGNSHVTLAGGFWEAAMINSIVQSGGRVRRRASDALGLASGSGEGTQTGPYAGINQHDRIGLNKARSSLSTAQLHREARCDFSHCRGELQISLDAYPSLGTTDRVHLKIQPFVVGVTSYSPNRRADNYQYRNIFQVAHIAQASADALITVVGTHSLEVGDRVKFESVRGFDRHDINGIEFSVTAVGGQADPNGGDLLHMTNFTLVETSTGSALDSTGKAWDVSSSFVHKVTSPTAAVPRPANGEHDWSYEQDDLVYLFVTFSEPVVVYGQPRLKLNLGDHYEADAADSYATFAGGGFGEKKAFWKNNEQNPLRRGEEAYAFANQRRYNEHSSSPGLSNDAHSDLSAFEDPYQIKPDGICLDRNDGCTSADTLEFGAIFKVRGTHQLEVGDIVIVRGVYGLDAEYLNKQLTVGSYVTDNEFSVEPPLELSGKTFFTGRISSSGIRGVDQDRGAGYINGARYTPGKDMGTPESGTVTVQRVNTGIRCRSFSLEAGDMTSSGSHGNHFCTFSTNTRRSSGLSYDGGSTTPSLRREVQFDEERIEQYMDNVLAFEYRVTSSSRGVAGEDDYDQAVGGLDLTSGQAHLTADLDYTGTNALDLNGGSIKRACADTYQVSAISAANPSELTLVTHASPQTSAISATHTLLPGDIIYVAGVEGADKDTVNGKYTIAAVSGSTVTLGETICLVPGTADGFPAGAGSFDVGSGVVYGSSCGVASPDFSGLSFTVDATKVYIRRKNVYNNDNTRCHFNDAIRTLPKPGDKMTGSSGAAQSLSYNKAVVIGRAYVQNVTCDSPDRTYGYNAAYGLQTGNDNSLGVPDVLDIKVHFSEPIKASCGVDNEDWVFQEQYPGLYYRVCAQIKLLLVTRDSFNGRNDNSTTGNPGETIFPTAFLYETGYDPPSVLNFRYVVRRNDETSDLQYYDTHSLFVNEHHGEDSHIRRVSDNKLAGIKLPPTERDGTGRHKYSLGALKDIRIMASF
jgi:hypothetical protein